MSKNSRRNSIRSHSLQTHREFYSDLERRAQQALLGENSVQRNLNLIEYDLEIQNSERRNSEYASNESRRELESQRRQILEASQWAAHAQRERIHLCSELEMKNRLYQECYAISSQELEELDCEVPNRGLLEGKESHTRVAVDHGIEAAKSLDDLITPKSITDRFGFDDGVSIEKVFR